MTRAVVRAIAALGALALRKDNGSEQEQAQGEERVAHRAGLRGKRVGAFARTRVRDAQKNEVWRSFFADSTLAPRAGSQRQSLAEWLALYRAHTHSLLVHTALAHLWVLVLPNGDRVLASAGDQVGACGMHSNGSDRPHTLRVPQTHVLHVWQQLIDVRRLLACPEVEEHHAAVLAAAHRVLLLALRVDAKPPHRLPAVAAPKFGIFDSEANHTLHRQLLRTRVAQLEDSNSTRCTPTQRN